PEPFHDPCRLMTMPQSSASIASKRSTVRAPRVVAPSRSLSTAVHRLASRPPPLAPAMLPSWLSCPTNTSSFATRRHSAKARAVCAFDPGSRGVRNLERSRPSCDKFLDVNAKGCPRRRILEDNLGIAVDDVNRLADDLAAASVHPALQVVTQLHDCWQ